MKNHHPNCRFLLVFILGILTTLPGAAQTAGPEKPWSVRMAESEMARWPESWQLDFQPALKWDYCHGLELGAMLDVYDRYGDSRFFDYALAYADTMVNDDGSIRKYKLEDYSLDRVNSGKMLFRLYEQTHQEGKEKVQPQTLSMVSESEYEYGAEAFEAYIEKQRDTDNIATTLIDKKNNVR